MDIPQALFDATAPTQRTLYDFAMHASAHMESLRECEALIADRYAADLDAHDAHARLALFTSQVPVLPEDDHELFRRIAAYEQQDAEEGRITVQGRTWVADARRRVALLLAAIRAAEARTGFDLRSQWNGLVLSLGHPQSSDAAFPILNARLRTASAFDAVIVFRELVLDDAYQFLCDRSDPFIVDGGANIGMSLAYFKWLYPAARILAFEPHPALYELCLDNIRANRWQDVDLKPWALSDHECEAVLHFSEAQPMASTTTGRLARLVPPDTLRSARVPAKPLSRFLGEPVDYLKLDIEGVEVSVLREAEEALRGVRQGFVEYHHDSANPNNPLGSLLNTLEHSGFDYRVLQPPAEIGCGYPYSTLLDAPVWSSNVYFKRGAKR